MSFSGRVGPLNEARQHSFAVGAKIVNARSYRVDPTVPYWTQLATRHAV
jgi:hypothetical protein